MGNKKDEIELLKTGRQLVNLTQQELSELINKDRSYIGKIESGERRLMPKVEKEVLAILSSRGLGHNEIQQLAYLIQSKKFEQTKKGVAKKCQ